jgi:hypothetical protein
MGTCTRLLGPSSLLFVVGLVSPTRHDPTVLLTAIEFQQLNNAFTRLHSFLLDHSVSSGWPSGTRGIQRLYLPRVYDPVGKKERVCMSTRCANIIDQTDSH